MSPPTPTPGVPPAAARNAQSAERHSAEQHLAPLKARVINVARRIGDNSADTNDQREILRIEGMLAAWQYDRDHAVYSPHRMCMVTTTRAARNTLRSRLSLARHFIAHHGIEEEMKIRDTDHRGHYLCELVPRAEPEESWLSWAKGGKKHGLSLPALTRMRAQEATRKAARSAAVKAKWAERTARTKAATEHIELPAGKRP